MKNHNRDRQRRKSPWAAQWGGGHILEGGKLLLKCHEAVTSNVALTISVSGVASVVSSIFLELSVSWGSASRICSNIGRSLPGSPWSIMKLTNTRRPLKGKHNHNDNEAKREWGSVTALQKFFFFLWTKIYQHHGSVYLPFIRREEQWQMQVLPFLKTVREKGIQRRVK